MCQVFISADPTLYDSRARSLRLHGVAEPLAVSRRQLPQVRAALRER